MPEGYTPQSGVKYRQERDVSVPPVRIDVVKGIENVRNVALSRLVEEIVYINLGKLRFGADDVQITPHGILVANFDGAWLYSPDGKLIREIYKNICEYEPFGIFGVMMTEGNKFTGISNVRYNEKDDRLLVKFRDYQMRSDNYRGFLGYIDMSGQFNVSADEIKQDPIIPIAEFGDVRMAYAENFVVHHAYRQDDFRMTSASFSGDTLCRFSFDYDSIRAKIFKKSVKIDTPTSYYHNEIFTFRPPFNDTLFRITAANVVKPVYVFDMGIQENLNYDQLYVLQGISEDSRYLYVKFTIRNYNGTNVRRQWKGLYDKSAREFFTLPVDNEMKPLEVGIENDIDGGMPFWLHRIGSRGEKKMFFSGKMMKNVLTEEWFAKSKASKPEKKAELMKFMQTVEDDDVVIIIAQ